MSDLRKIVSTVSKAEQELATWRKLVAILSMEYISRDSSEASDKIVTDAGTEVSEAVVQSVIDYITDNNILPIEEFLEKLLSSRLLPPTTVD